MKWQQSVKDPLQSINKNSAKGTVNPPDQSSSAFPESKYLLKFKNRTTETTSTDLFFVSLFLTLSKYLVTALGYVQIKVKSTDKHCFLKRLLQLLPQTDDSTTEYMPLWTHVHKIITKTTLSAVIRN